MERSEPALVPQWLRNTGNVMGAGNLAHHSASSSSHSDVLAPTQSNRNRTYKSICDFDSPRAFLDRTYSVNSWRSSSSNGSTKHAYSSFSKSHRDKDRDRDKEKYNFGDHWNRDCSDSLGNIFASRIDKDKLRRFDLMVLKEQSDLMHQRAAGESKHGNGDHHHANGVPSGGRVGNSIRKAGFEKDFPSLGIEERQGGPDVGRVLSPGLSMGVQSLLGSSALVDGEGWRSALAVVPPSLAQQAAVTTSGPSVLNAVSGLNMAETLAQVPSRASSAPQLSVKTHRLEELAIKQSRQLIPMTPSSSKAPVLSSDKSKPKTAVRNGEMIAAPKIGQQQLPSLNLANQNVKSDAAKSSHGKFVILKPVRENGVSPAAKEVSSPTSSASSPMEIVQGFLAPSSTPTSLRGANDPKSSTIDSKAPNTTSMVEKKPASQAQSRKEFLNLMRKKSSINASTSIPDSGAPLSSVSMEKTSDAVLEVACTPNPHVVQNGGEIIRNDTTCKEDESFSDGREVDLSLSAAVYPEEEEAAFLRSLGWEENGGEEGGLTEEEINGFLQEYIRLRPSLKLCGGVMQRLSMLPDSHASVLSGASLGLSSTDTGSNA